MAWTADFVDAEVPTAAKLNTMLADDKAWQGNVNGGGFQLTNLGALLLKVQALPGSPLEGMVAYDGAAKLLKFYDGAAWKSGAAGQVRSLVHASGGQTLSTATWTLLNFDTEDFDVGGCHDNVTNNTRLTVPASGEGLYLVTGQVCFGTNNTGFRSANVYKNGSSVGTVYTSVSATNGDSSILQVTGILSLAAADYLELKAYQNSGGNLATIGGYSALSFAKLT